MLLFQMNLQPGGAGVRWLSEEAEHVNTVILQPVQKKLPEVVVPMVAEPKTAIAEAFAIAEAYAEAQALLQRLGVSQQGLDSQIKEQSLQARQIKARQDKAEIQAQLMEEQDDMAVATLLVMLL